MAQNLIPRWVNLLCFCVGLVFVHGCDVCVVHHYCIGPFWDHIHVRNFLDIAHILTELPPCFVSSDDEQRGCAKPNGDEDCLAPEALWKRSECKNHQGSEKSLGTWGKEKRTRAYNRRGVAEQGWAGCDRTSLLSHSRGTTAPGFAMRDGNVSQHVIPFGPF